MRIWIPEYEQGDGWWMRQAARIMLRIRSIYYHGEMAQCVCPGCPIRTERASASGMCHGCATEYCEHDEAAECPDCGDFPDIWTDGSAWYAGCGNIEVAGDSSDDAVELWNKRARAIREVQNVQADDDWLLPGEIQVSNEMAAMLNRLSPSQRRRFWVSIKHGCEEYAALSKARSRT